jgi:hypothetical protein
MKTLFTLLFSLSSLIAAACSCAPYYSFCEFKSQINPDLILTAVVLDTNQNGISLGKLHVLEGVEPRDTIKVWNDTNYNCTGTVSMRASLIGEVGDTVIVMLPKIDSVYTNWGVLGDYRTPMHLCGRSFLKIKNDSLSVPPNTYYDYSTIPPKFYRSDRPTYTDFIRYYDQYGGCSALRKGDFQYTPFPESISTYWTDLEDVTSLQQSYHHQNRITKDTIISGMTYHKLLRTTKHTVYHSSGSVSYSQNVYGYFRNDSINKKVWLRLAGANSDSLLYDFNLEVGDTISNTYRFNYPTSPNPNFKIDSISFSKLGGKLHKVYHTSGPCANDSLIEGIGFSSGTFLNNTPCFLGATYNLECMNIDGENYYPDSTYNCNLITQLVQFSNSKNAISVYPNPIGTEFNISFPSEIINLSIYDLNGKLVQQLDESAKRHSLKVEPGSYILRIEDQDNQLYFKKIIKY